MVIRAVVIRAAVIRAAVIRAVVIRAAVIGAVVIYFSGNQSSGNQSSGNWRIVPTAAPVRCSVRVRQQQPTSTTTVPLAAIQARRSCRASIRALAIGLPGRTAHCPDPILRAAVAALSRTARNQLKVDPARPSRVASEILKQRAVSMPLTCSRRAVSAPLVACK